MTQITSNIESFIKDKIGYIQEIISNTIISIKNNNYLDSNLFSENDKNLSVTILTDLHDKTEDIKNNVNGKKKNQNDESLLTELQKIIDKLSMIICGFGTNHIKDLLFVSFGTEYKNLKFNDDIFNGKFEIILKFIIPIGYKITSWKQKDNYFQKNTIYCSDKIVDTLFNLEEANNIECMNNADVSEENVRLYLNSIKIVIQNPKLKKTMVINGLIKDYPISCLMNNIYIKHRFMELNDTSFTDDCNVKETFENMISTLSIKDLLVYSKADLIKKNMMAIKDIQFIKTTHIDNIVKKFLDSNIVSKRAFLINLLLYSEDNEVQHICYIMYDLINTNTVSNETETEGAIIYNSFPPYIKKKFKNIIKLNIKTVQESNQIYESNKISLEQQIRMLKIDDATREKAMNKLNDIKGKPDEMTLKTKQYLEGLIKIPFGIYCEEPIIKKVKDNNAYFIEFLKQYSYLFDKLIIPSKKKYTNAETETHISYISNNLGNNMKTHIINNLSNCSLKTLACICNQIRAISKHQNIVLSPIKQKNKASINEYIKQYFENSNNSINTYNEIYNTISASKNEKSINIDADITKINTNIHEISSDLVKMENILDESIHGHNNAKKQIMKIIGQWMNGEKEGYSFGFEGSPGIGTTSLANKGLTQCLQNDENDSRPFNFIALGGSSNGSFLEGHGYTYMNSTWGKIVDILMDSKCMNPIIYIDELDKVSKTEQGRELIGILTHLIDPTQNSSFQDKYFTGINIDVSKVLFIFSYNDPEQIDKILLDRIHRIRFENLSLNEKIIIVNKFILPEINKKMGFEDILHLSNDCIQYIIESYTLEPGVRKLKEILFDLYGEINLQLLKNNTDIGKIPLKLSVEELEIKYMSKYTKIKEHKIHKNPEAGIINGLWANSLGCGGIIQIQSLFYPSSSFLELQLTGLQGDAMKESMNVAKSLAWSLTDNNTKKEWLEYFKETKCQGLHIHCPEGGISKDGPSAGAAITTAIYSLLTKQKIKNDIAITGEITLNGDVTAIGGLDLKLTYGIKAGVKTFLFPKENSREFSLWCDKNDIPSDITFIEITSIKNIFSHVFV